MSRYLAIAMLLPYVFAEGTTATCRKNSHVLLVASCEPLGVISLRLIRAWALIEMCRFDPDSRIDGKYPRAVRRILFRSYIAKYDRIHIPKGVW